jgi:hypothetical protein
MVVFRWTAREGLQRLPACPAADKLAKDGRVRYDQKSISTRMVLPHSITYISTRIMRIRLRAAREGLQFSLADKLAKDGRARYDQKSISTRITRIRFAMAGRSVRLKTGKRMRGDFKGGNIPTFGNLHEPTLNETFMPMLACIFHPHVYMTFVPYCRCPYIGGGDYYTNVKPVMLPILSP